MEQSTESEGWVQLQSMITTGYVKKYREILEGKATCRLHKMKPKTGSEAGFDSQQETRKRPPSKKSFIIRI
jgi:hypothetical protein